VSALSQTRGGNTGHGFGFGVFLFGNENLSTSVIDLRDYNSIPNE